MVPVLMLLLAAVWPAVSSAKRESKQPVNGNKQPEIVFSQDMTTIPTLPFRRFTSSAGNSNVSSAGMRHTYQTA